MEEFLKALNGGKGDLDAWLECNNEAECRVAIFGAIAAEREACAKVCEELPAELEEFGALNRAAAAIRERSNV